MGINDNFKYLNSGLPENIARLKAWGDYEGATRLIDQWLQRSDLSEAMRGSLIVQREIISRMAFNYTFTKEEALELIRQHIEGFTEEEFDQKVDRGQIGWIYVNGEKHFHDRFYSTLCKVDADFARRVGKPLSATQEPHIEQCIARMKENGSYTNRIRIRASIRMEDAVFTSGTFVRVHLPIPAACDQQSDIVIEKIEPDTGMIAPEDAEQRTICWEETMQENHEFAVEYSYLHTARYTDTTTLQGLPIEAAFDTEEKAPHIVFTPYIKALVAELTEGVTDPLEKARRFYDFITKNMKYNFMPAYFVLDSIAENCARNYSGDCGVFALLFITLCRCAGIPAQWQSGLVAEPDFCGCHDWARFYVAPYGWLYADPSYGVSAHRRGDEDRRKFYFGNLDPYRMVANREFQADFTIGSNHWRIDPYDNQVGEMETADRGLRSHEVVTTKEVLCCEEEIRSSKEEALMSITPYIHRLVIPFLDIYTSVFIIQTEQGAVLFDTATYPEDVDQYIVPALNKLGISQATLKYVIISHNHRDHAGGLARFAELYPETQIVAGSDQCQERVPERQVQVLMDGDMLGKHLKVVSIPGHTEDCIAILDARTQTLLTGDSLQLYGIYGSGNWGANIRYILEHMAATEKIQEMDIQTIVASHDYHPYGYRADGKEAIAKYVDACSQALSDIQKFIQQHASKEDAELAASYNAASGLPTVGAHVVRALRQLL